MARLWSWLVVWLLVQQARGWNSAGSLSQIYTFQEFYTDAQYGPDFGYYSTGRILHEDGPSDNGFATGEQGSGNQEWFNSYTTLPMSLSPDFAHALCDRLATMWEVMGRPSPFVLAEFGGGTGMLARDIMRRIRDTHGDFYQALARYVIGERSAALREAQRITAAEFIAADKLMVVPADGRQASQIRPVLEEVFGGPGNPVHGLVLSNELLDEFDPVLLRLKWHTNREPSERDCASCESYRETYVLHSVDTATLSVLVEGNGGTLGAGPHEANMEELLWEGDALHCGLLKSRELTAAMQAVRQDLTPAEQEVCAPTMVCCFPFLLAVDQVLQYRSEALTEMLQKEENGATGMTRVYRHYAERVNGTVPLSKERYRQLRRLAAARGPEFEKTFLLTGGTEGGKELPGHVHSHEVQLALSDARCRELSGWLQRHAARLSAAARLRDGSAVIFTGHPEPPMTAMQLKLVVRPGEAAFTEEAGKLIDQGFLVTLDYGADADALMWNQLIRPDFAGIHTMDARNEFSDLCSSYLACPGLQDLTSSVDFTEVAEAGRELGGWEVRAYGPVFLLELSFDATHLDLAPDFDDPYRLGHLVERAGNLDSQGLRAWYRKPETDPWASFKLLVQHKGELGANWTLGPHGMAWPLHASPRLFRSPSPCWSRDLTKPPLASLVTAASRNALGQKAEKLYWSKSSIWTPDLITPDLHLTPPLEDEPVEDAHVYDTMLSQFAAVMLGSGIDVDELLDVQHDAQQQAYADMHLALLLVDYWRLLEPLGGDTLEHIKVRINHVYKVAQSRQLDQLFGAEDFDRVFNNLRSSVFEQGCTAPAENTSSGARQRPEYPPYICLASKALGTPLRR